jgi:glucose/arabinose dehydrogenase
MSSKAIEIIFVLSMILIIDLYVAPVESSSSQSYEKSNEPTVRDPGLKVEIVFNGSKFFTTMAFLGTNDILALEKNNGKVQRIVDGNILHTVLDANVSNRYERGMLGIAVSKQENGNESKNNLFPTYIFLFYTEPSDYSCHINKSCNKVDTPVVNHLYRYELLYNRLVHPKVILNLSSGPFLVHMGGVMSIGHDNNVYVMTGDGSFGNTTDVDQNILNTQSANAPNGSEAIGRGGILRITRDGGIVGEGILGSSYPLNLYYAYGIRSSFGMDFDPVTGNLWDTENGPEYGDEINLVKPGFNSGWNKVQGIWNNNVYKNGEPVSNPNNLVDFGGKGIYSSPEFTWYQPSVSPTALKFLNSHKLGEQYLNDMFVGDFHRGNLYDFNLKENRTKLDLHGPLKDKIADTPTELQSIIFGRGFGSITDIEVGPDGYLYVLSHYNTTTDYSEGISTIYRIVPVDIK